jgi:hypothetical protein
MIKNAECVQLEESYSYLRAKLVSLCGWLAPTRAPHRTSETLEARAEDHHIYGLLL